VSEVTQILQAVRSGEPSAPDELLRLVYAELRKLAAQRMASEPEGQTLQATALVHEAWLKLGGASFENRAHFFSAAAEAMRRILVDNARRKHSVKHGGGWQRADVLTLDVAAETAGEHILAVHEALDKLAARDPLGAELIKLRFFAGLPNIEAAQILGIPERTAKRAWAYARAWLFEELRGGES